MTISKTKIRQIESKARRIMKLDGSIWEKHKWSSEGDVNDEIYKKEIKKKIKKGSLNYTYYYIFEDANFHSLNRNLEEIGAFKKNRSEKEYQEYRNAGGRTWDL